MNTTIPTLFLLGLALIMMVAPFATLAMFVTITAVSVTIWLLWTLIQNLTVDPEVYEEVYQVVDISSDRRL